MSVRPTQTKSGYPRRSRQPYPTADPEPAADPAGESATDHTVPPGTPSTSARSEPVPTEHQPALEPQPQPSRVDRRAARRMRRNLAIVCGVVVAVCLILTILIVNMARTRPSALALRSRSAFSAAGPSAAARPFPAVPIGPTRDAPASEGGNP